jgi:MYXO-CTERM domain-containing protein
MRGVHFLAFLPLLGASVLASRDAHAQTIPSVSAILGQVQLCDTTARTCRGAEPPGMTVNMLNYEECSDDLSYRFDLQITYPSSSYALQAWVGQTDCTVAANRSACWPVAAPATPSSTDYVLEVRTQDIVAGAFAPTRSPAYAGASNSSVCLSQNRTVETDFTLYMFMTDESGNAVGVSQQFPLVVDLRAGVVAGPITLTQSDATMRVNIPETTDPDTQGYNVYCDPPAYDLAAAAPSQTCSPSSVLVAGASVDGYAADAGAPACGPIGKYLCATGLGSQTSIPIHGIGGGEWINVAVAATDAEGNIGPLSNVACGQAPGNRPWKETGTTGLVETTAPDAGAATSASALSSTESSGGASSGTAEAEAAGVSCSAKGPGAPNGVAGFGVLMIAAVAARARRKTRASANE